MLTRSLHELAIGTLFTSPQVNKYLLAYLTKDPAINNEMSISELVKACRKKLEHDLDQDHLRRFRLNDMAQIFDALWSDELLSSGNLPVMNELFTRLMVRNGDYLQYQPSQVQAYARLAAEIDPTLLAGWHLAGWLHQSLPLPNDAERIINHQLPFFAPPPNSHKPYAEGHVHLGGVRFDLLILGERLFHSIGEETQEHETFLRLRRLIGVLLNVGNVNTKTDHALLCAALTNACTNQLDPFDNLDLDWPTLRETCILRANIVDASWLRWQLAQAVTAGELARAWLWLVVYAWFLYRKKDCPPDLRVAIFYLFTSLTQIRRRLIMDGQGLSRFVNDYSNAVERKKSNKLNAKGANVIRELMADAADAAEIKISPEKFEPKLVANMANATSAAYAVPVPFFNCLAPNQLLGREELAYIKQLEQWHFCAHFIRRKEDHKTRANLWAVAEKLQNVLCNQSGWNLDAFFGGHANEGFHFHPAYWLRGLDIAGDENLLRNDVFAPILRWLRRGFLPHPPTAHPAPNFHLSIHVGEDYPHPLSGMRHIDETVRFCELRTGDRLGHALAIGIEPAFWVARQGDMVLPVDEHLDNLVWAWHYACELSGRLPLANQIIPLLERRIAHFVNFIPWLNPQTEPPLLWPTEQVKSATSQHQSTVKYYIAPNTLHQAWLLRKNCYHQYCQTQTIAIDGDMLNVAVPDYERLKNREDATPTPVAAQASGQNCAEQIYLDRERLRLLYQNSPHQDKLPHHDELRRVLVRVADARDWARRDHADGGKGTFLYDYETPEELQFMYALQDYLLDQYDRQGLIIETNPSSNVYIARMENHAEHPIFRWQPPDEATLVSGKIHNQFGLRRGPIRVLVNTDDPGIMPTTLRTEFALLLEAAIDLGISSTVAQVWQERLRQFGMDEFKGKHQNIFRRIVHGNL